jgi:hypothetical protein
MSVRWGEGRYGVKAEILKADPPTPRLRADENDEMKRTRFANERLRMSGDCQSGMETGGGTPKRL